MYSISNVYYPLSVKRTVVVPICCLFHKIQLSRHDSVDEIVAFDIWAEPTAIGIRGMSNIFSAAIYAMESQLSERRHTGADCDFVRHNLIRHWV